MGKKLGFQDIRIANAHAGMSVVKLNFFKWLEQGYYGSIDYMARHGTKRTRPDELEPGMQAAHYNGMHELYTAFSKK